MPHYYQRQIPAAHMKTRTTNQLELSLPIQSLKRTLSASCTEVTLDYKTIGSAQTLMTNESPHPKRKTFRNKQRPRSRKLADMQELIPILGLASLITETEPQARPRTPDSTSSMSGNELNWVVTKRRCVQPVRVPTNKHGFKRPMLKTKFSPGALSRAATHAAIAYFIWNQKQKPPNGVNGHSNCSILL